MTNKHEQDIEYQPYHIRKWQSNQMSIMEKPHKITEKMEVYVIAKNFKIVRK